MKKNPSRENVLMAVEQLEHPEIAATLGDLGMILDVSVQGNTATVAMALPTTEIPEVVRNALIDIMHQPLEKLGLQLKVEFFEMTEEGRNIFFALARANWKGSI
jgi:metal-sulfur cluster biosynthetic enzyme